ncbi:MAG: hypothetical protein MJZ61_01475 [Bacteroidales bacterium]|nr:hypothetical protein [Bacteroidales bacterium]
MTNNTLSKPLGISDQSGEDFIGELLDGAPSHPIIFDRIQNTAKYGEIIFDFVLCGNLLDKKTFTYEELYKSNRQKYDKLINLARKAQASITIVCYSNHGCTGFNEVLTFYISKSDYNNVHRSLYSREEFSTRFRKINSGE